MLGVEEHPQDAILLLKKNVCSDRLAQPPQLLFPHAYLSKLDPAGPTTVMPRNKLSARAIAEYRKTAQAIAQHPWYLFSAAKYLQDWATNNENGQQPMEPPLNKYVLEAHTDNTILANVTHAGDFAPGTPRFVTVTRAAPTKAVQRRIRTKQPEHPTMVPEESAEVKRGFEIPEDPVPELKKHKRGSKARPQMKLGCSKCRRSGSGCATCRAKMNTTLDEAEGDLNLFGAGPL